MSDFWNAKYKQSDFLYGTQPNAFVKEQIDSLNPGKILFPAEGEGRNAVYAATQGWNVTAFDPSKVGQQKALQLAKTKNVHINYVLKGYDKVNFLYESFDTIAIAFAHMPSGMRKIMHTNYINWLKPRGKILMEVFSKEQLKYASGGPKNLDMLLSIADIENDFKNLSDYHVSCVITYLNEGPGHQGEASVIRFVGTK